MNNELTPKHRARVFTEIWGHKPFMIMGESVHLLAAARAFLFGIGWAEEFCDPEMESFRNFLRSLNGKLSKHITDSDDGVSWYHELLKRNRGDQALAFQEFVQILKILAAKEGLI